MKQRTLAFLIALTLLIPCILGFPTAASAEEETATVPSGVWDGSYDTAWFNANSETKEATLTTPQQLAGMTQLNKGGQKFEGWTVRLGANLFMNAGNAEDWQTAAPANEWRPICNFMGIFDGQGYSISGLYCKNPSEEGVGLFASLNNATVKNLIVTNSLLIGKCEVGAVAGFIRNNAARMENIYSDAILSVDSASDAGARSGGILGLNDCIQESTLKRCWFDGTIAADSATDNWATRVGGLVGKTAGVTTLEDCLYTGSLTGHSQIGGLIGAVEGRGSASLTRCLMLGEVISNRNGGGCFAGQFVGILFGALFANVSNCYGLDSYQVRYLNAGTNTANKTAYSSTNASGRLTGTEEIDYGRFSLAELTGENAKSKLTAFDFDTVWTVMPNGTPVLRALAAARMTPTLYGFQNTEVGEANTYSIRFVSTLSSIPERAGTTIAVTAATGTYDLSKEATCVFTSLLADERGKMTAKTSYALGGRYLMALTVENIPTAEGRLTFTVTPWVEEDGVRYTGESVQVIFDAGTPQATEN